MAGLLFLFSGIFSDGPIQPCVPEKHYAIAFHPDGFCGKQGQPHTFADYQSYEFWSRVMLIGWPLGMGVLLILHFAGRKP